MKIVLSLLAEYLTLHPGTTVPQLCHSLTQLGHEIDGVSGAEPPQLSRFPHVVVGHIISREQHPQADRLGVCQVDVGATHGGIRTIVCGAPNARAGLTVAVALPGATLPGDFTIGTSKIRGVESHGMICSMRELGLGDEHNGIWELTTTHPIGTALDATLPAPEVVLDVAVTPNRGDCLSHLGIARELAAAGLGTLTLPAPIAPTIASFGTSISTPIGRSIAIATTTPNCPVLHAIQLTGVTNQPSPPHIQQQLIAAGFRPRSAVVDATNYVMLMLGQPLHAYDLAKISGGITATTAKGGEIFHGIADTTLTLTAGDTVIADDNGIVGLAGILGGSSTAVSEGTTSVLLEGAVFSRISIALTGQHHSLHTDARARFERGIDPALTPHAVQLAAQLICSWTGATSSPLTNAGTAPNAPTTISYSPTFCASFGGLHVTEDQQQTILQNLGFIVKTGTPWQVTPPTWRTHMDTPEDLVEEVLRVVGYDQIPSVLPPSMGAQHTINGTAITLDRLARKAVALAGCTEVITYSFIGKDTAQIFTPTENLLHLANPLAETSMTTMRPSLLPGLLQALAGNLRHSQPSPRLAEVGKVYTTQSEALMAAAVLSPSGTRHWHSTPLASDVFAAKALAIQVLETLGAPIASLTTTPLTDHVAYHPGKAGTLSIGPMVLARFGELHPTLRNQFDLKIQPIAAVEWFLEPLLKLKTKTKTFAPNPYPAVQRDLAFILSNTVTASAITTALAATNRTLIKGVQVFDRYEGTHVPQGHHSLALTVTLQSAAGTLTDADITPVIDALITTAQTQFQATLRA